MKRIHAVMPIREYRNYFFRHIRDSGDVVFHNGDIYPNGYETVRAESYVRSSEKLTTKDRLQPLQQSYGLNRFVIWAVSAWPLGQDIRRIALDPLRFRSTEVVWRNFTASSDADQLEPSSRDGSTYVLEEFFVPVERSDEFVPAMRAILRRRHVNAMNVSIRHARPDTTTLLAWAPREVFAFVLCYKQKTDSASQRAVDEWTRELIDAALNVGGSSKFRNMLWDRYYRP